MSIMDQIKAHKSKLQVADAQEAHEEENVRRLILDGSGNSRIIRKTGVSTAFIAEVKKRMRKEGYCI